MGTEPPLCVDLDGTLVHTDTLVEGLISLLHHHIWLIFALPFWVLAGKAKFKERVAAQAELNVAELPFSQKLTERLRWEHEQGRRLVLVTGADQKTARQVSEHLGIFDEFLASDGVANLSGKDKANELVRRFGRKGYDYIGDSQKDLPVWANARKALAVSSSAGLLRRARTANPDLEVIETRTRPRWRALLKATRPHQWAKNLLVFVPLLTGRMLGDTDKLIPAVLAFLALDLTSSGIYILNDLWDVSADRQHTTKRKRPFASGGLSLQTGFLAGFVFTAAGLCLAALVGPWLLVGVVLLKVLLSWAYSVFLKRKIILDIIVLSSLYAMRILVGSVASGVPISPWLWGVSIFFFLSLAFAKRCSELTDLKTRNLKEAAGRSYLVDDLPLLMAGGLCSGYLSIMVFTIYMNSDTVKVLYANPDLLWVAVPFLVYWLTRLWLYVQRGEMNQDPVVFVLKDRVSYLTGAAILMVMWAATL